VPIFTKTILLLFIDIYLLALGQQKFSVFFILENSLGRGADRIIYIWWLWTKIFFRHQDDNWVNCL